MEEEKWYTLNLKALYKKYAEFPEEDGQVQVCGGGLCKSGQSGNYYGRYECSEFHNMLVWNTWCYFSYYFDFSNCDHDFRLMYLR